MGHRGEWRRVPTYHFSRARCDCSSFPFGHSIMPSTSPSVLHQSWSQHIALPYHFLLFNVPMACLYNPYKRNLVADGGFCDPVRILLTVLSAWLKTRSTSLILAKYPFSSHIRPFNVPTESDITSVDVAPPRVGSGALIEVARESALVTGTRYSARQKQKGRYNRTKQWMTDGVHDAMTMRSRVEMAFVVARPWRLGLGCSGAGALAMWQCDRWFHVSADILCLHRSLFLC